LMFPFFLNQNGRVLVTEIQVHVPKKYPFVDPIERRVTNHE